MFQTSVSSSPRGRHDLPRQAEVSAGGATVSPTSNAGPRPEHHVSGRSEQAQCGPPSYYPRQTAPTPVPERHEQLPYRTIFPAYATQQPAATSSRLPQHKSSSNNGSSIPTESSPQSQQYNSPPPAESARRPKIKSPFSPTASSPPIRNSLSSHAGDLGRRLAEERSKNHQLMQRINDLESTVSSLKEGKHDHVMGTDNQPHHCFSSSPVETPTANSSGKEGFGIHQMHGLEGAGKKSENLSQRENLADKNNGPSPKAQPFEVRRDHLTMKLLERASRLLSESVNGHDTDKTNPKSADSQHNVSHDGNDGSSLTQERMREYHELVTEFHSEQQSHGDLDGEEMISREDILWLFSELQWRFEELYTGFAEGRSKNNHVPSSGDEEWKWCLEGLVGVVKEAMKPAPAPSQTNVRQLNGHINKPVLSNDTRILQEEVSSLNQRLASFAAEHKETCGSLYEDMEAMKRDYQEQIAKKSQCIQDLESKISEQEEYIAQIQKEKQKDQQLIQEEKQKLTLSKEGTAVRIQYLEGMLRSLQIELKGSKSPQKTNSRRTDGADVESERGTLSAPVFMRDLTSSMHDVDQMQQELHVAGSVVQVEANNKARSNAQKDTAPSSESPEMRKLLDQIASLGNSLADSENTRANLLDDFQQERKKYILQFKQLQDILKLLTEEENTEHT